MVFRQHIAVGLDEIIAQFDDVVDGKFRRCGGIQHRRMIDVLLLQGQRRFNGQQLRIDVGHIHRRTLGRQCADISTVDSRAIDQTGNFHHRIGRQIGDESVVQHIAADLENSVGVDGINDSGTVFLAPLVSQRRSIQQRGYSSSGMFHSATSSG